MGRVLLTRVLLRDGGRPLVQLEGPVVTLGAPEHQGPPAQRFVETIFGDAAPADDLCSEIEVHVCKPEFVAIYAEPRDFHQGVDLGGLVAAMDCVV